MPKNLINTETRPDTRIPQSHAGGQGLYLRSLDHLGRSSEAKDRKTPKKVKCDGRTDRQTDGWTDKAWCRVAKHATKNRVLQMDGPTKAGRSRD